MIFSEFMFPFVEMYSIEYNIYITGAICRIIIFLYKSLTVYNIVEYTGLLFD